MDPLSEVIKHVFWSYGGCQHVPRNLMYSCRVLLASVRKSTYLPFDSILPSIGLYTHMRLLATTRVFFFRTVIPDD